MRPAAVMLRQPRLMRLRRMVGLFAFTYLLLHFLTWLVLDRGLDWNGVVADIAKRPFITVGFAALLLLIPLAVTSTDRWMRRLGRRWHSLHKLVYVAALLGAAAFPVAGEGRLARAGPVHRRLRGADGLALAEAPRRTADIVAPSRETA